MTLKSLSDSVFYIPSPSNIGVVKCNGNKVALIDSGLDASTGKNLLKLLRKYELFPVAVINTHFHSDHCGGNRFLKEKADVKIYASKVASVVIEHPFINSYSLFCGVLPVDTLRNKFVMAEPAKVDIVIDEEGEIAIADKRFNVIPLPGHAPGHVGVAVDGVLFCGDAFLSERVLSKVKIPFNVHIGEQKRTLEKLLNLDFKVFLPSHGGPVENIAEIVKINKKAILKVENAVIESLEKEEKTTETIMSDVCAALNLTIKDSYHYFLIRAAIHAYLSYLSSLGEIYFKVSNNSLIWALNKR
ncbi:MBL fold metallo-hydrolase [Desulfurobacterium atlanticum]|uniref:Glyoxylase, beta-lactamase superfamily II n=1 Tax=Desulfurobacterium atlanticum TaxID=240169 RepID=A0A238Z5P2_9BACT|nr:MBL fold metallo-hydrolase [Desulfurobacterium atlanticum]SNR78319.1 Glyoxylase, beta-lactamase superfamily II [Desulfurobacterium atlanticum]